MASSRALKIAAVVVVLGAIGAWRLTRRPEASPPTPVAIVTLAEAARALDGDAAAFDTLTAGIAIGEDERAALGALFRAGDLAALDARPRLGVAAWRAALHARTDARSPRPPAPVEGGHELLGLPTRRPPPPYEPPRIAIGHGLSAGARIDPEKRARAADAERLAEVLERLSMGAARGGTYQLDLDGASTVASATGLVRWLMAHNHAVTVIDERFALDAARLAEGDQSVAAPLWLETADTAADGAPIAVPAVHARIRIRIRGKLVTADVTLENALDLGGHGGGGLRFRPDLEADPAWTGGRVAHTYEGPRAIEAVRLMALLRARAEEALQAKGRRNDGALALGAGALTPALIELSLNGQTTLWPLLHDPALFDGSGDVDRLVRALPVDDGAERPGRERLRGSLAWEEGAIPFPALAAALRTLGP